MAKPKKPQTKLSLVEPPKNLDIHYIKTASYRTYHVDGVFGGATASGQIYAEFFVQRPVTPQTIRYAVTPEGMIADELSQEGKSGIVREIEAGIVMDVSMAIALKDWLEKSIKVANDMEEKLKKANVPNPTK